MPILIIGMNTQNNTMAFLNKKSVLFLLILTLLTSALCANNAVILKKQTVSLDIDVSNVAIVITSSEEQESISYTTQLKQGTKLSCVEHQKKLRVRSVYPTEGTIYITVPQKMLLESCLIRSNLSDISVTGIQAVHFTVSMANGNIAIQNAKLKNSVITLASGTFTANYSVVGAAAFCISDVTANVTFQGDEKNHYLEYGKDDTDLYINETLYTALRGSFGNSRGKKKIIISAGSSTINLFFVKKADTE